MRVYLPDADGEYDSRVVTMLKRNYRCVCVCMRVCVCACTVGTPTENKRNYRCVYVCEYEGMCVVRMPTENMSRLWRLY
jgi:hypothetical protein